MKFVEICGQIKDVVNVDVELKKDLGWFLRSAQKRWTAVQIISLAIKYMDGEIDKLEPEQEINKEKIAEIEYSFYILNQIIKEHKLDLN